ncbi:MAG TPA: hypothetical protein VFV31_05920 [Chitinophagaceae bacterium]|nr:hypothetical protein [Chitinophagaceae bacterium]
MTDLNHIELPPAALLELYRNSLVQAGPGKPPLQAETMAAASTWKSLGSNEKNILVIVNEPGAVFLPDEELAFFTSILGACQLSLADVAILNFHHYPESRYKELLDFFRSKIVFLMGVEPAAIGLPVIFPQYQLQAFAGNTFLYTPSLQIMKDDRQEKTNLWTTLKRLFNL